MSVSLDRLSPAVTECAPMVGVCPLAASDLCSHPRTRRAIFAQTIPSRDRLRVLVDLCDDCLDRVRGQPLTLSYPHDSPVGQLWSHIPFSYFGDEALPRLDVPRSS